LTVAQPVAYGRGHASKTTLDVPFSGDERIPYRHYGSSDHKGVKVEAGAIELRNAKARLECERVGSARRVLILKDEEAERKESFVKLGREVDNRLDGKNQWWDVTIANRVWIMHPGLNGAC
jgi:hypothetical protein